MQREGGAMKRAVLALGQFVLFLVCFAVGSFAAPLHVRQVLGVTPDGTRIFLWDGVILMVLLLALLAGIEAARRRLATAGVWTVGAFVAAGLVGLLLRLGFMTV
jgi:hypothetical protein